MDPGAGRRRIAPGAAVLSCMLLAGTSAAALATPAALERDLMRLSTTRALSAPVRVARPAIAVALMARGRRCAAAHPLRLTVGSGPVTLLRATLRSARWRALRATVRLPAGRRRLTLQVSGGARSCRRADVRGLRLVPGRIPLEGVPTPLGPRRRIPLGAALSAEATIGLDGPLNRAFYTGFDAMTPENAMKMAYVETDRGRFDFTAADLLVNYARTHGKLARGHPLVWDRQLPGWLTRGRWTRPQLEDILHTWIVTMVTRYRANVGEWDVVNEPLDSDGRLRPSIWMDVIGPDYIPLAFRWAREADPSAGLFLNEFDADVPGPKQEGLIRLLAGLKAQGAPITGVGIQAHWSLATPIDEGQLLQAARRMVRPGLDLEFTEADVAIDGGPDPLGRQAAEFAKAARVCQSIAVCTRFTVWGVSDRDSWRGAGLAPLLLDGAFRPKPAYAAVRAALAAG